VEGASVDEVAALIDRMRAVEPHVTVAGPAPEAAIRELEAVFGHPMPPSYRAFLARFGGLTIHANCVSGVTDGQIDGEMGRAWCDTQVARERWRLPAELLVVEPDEEEPACLDFGRREPHGECPVVRFQSYRGSAYVTDPSFGVWLVESLKASVEAWSE
jgi:hypothetical protein